MIRYFLTEKRELKELGEFREKSWVYVVSPDSSDIEALSKLGIDEDFVWDALDPEERARFEQDEDIIYVIAKVPYYDEEDPEVPYKTLPIGIAITPTAFVTICLKDNEIFKDFFQKKIKDFSTKKRNRFLLRIFEVAVIYYLRYLKEIRKRSNDIEKELHRSTRNKELVAMLNLEKSLVYFTTSLRSNELMFENSKWRVFLHSTKRMKTFLKT